MLTGAGMQTCKTRHALQGACKQLLPRRHRSQAQRTFSATVAWLAIDISGSVRLFHRWTTAGWPPLKRIVGLRRKVWAGVERWRARPAAAKPC